LLRVYTQKSIGVKILLPIVSFKHCVQTYNIYICFFHCTCIYSYLLISRAVRGIRRCSYERKTIVDIVYYFLCVIANTF